ncbi:MAG: HAD family hydrolase [Anaerolineales bacterium]|jgi:putative hydrolase of the HAD superfamily|nr:HAD family hydrolase [Anaerolineales bacterium]
MIKALIFDFDGLVLDTETPEYQAWQNIYAEFGQTLTLENWGQIVGGTAASDFHPITHLEELTQRSLADFELAARTQADSMRTILSAKPRPGVIETLETAQRLGLKLAIASSSPHEWVDGHLQRLGLFDYFETVQCREDVSQPKPEPELFLAAQTKLGVGRHEALVFEDSPNGVLAANRAGIRVVAIPNPLTQKLDFPPTTLTLNEMSDLPLEELLRQLS